jgi:hypothetical protein
MGGTERPVEELTEALTQILARPVDALAATG